MFKAKKSLSLLLLILAMIFALAACGNGETSESVEETTEETTETTKEESVAPEEESSEDGTYEGSAKGYGGDVTVKVSLDGQEIKAIEAEAPDETSTIGGAAIDELVEKVIAAQSTQIDGVAGATLTSDAFFQAVDQALESAGIDPTSLTPQGVEEEEALELDQEADVVVIGAGGAGLTAAITAAEEGKTVIILEKAPNAGGNTNRATGGMNAAETHYQEEQGIEDTADIFYEDTMKGGHDINDPALVRILVDNSNDSIDWLDTIDAHLSNVGFAGGATNARSHRPVDENDKIISVGPYLVEKLLAKADEMDNITIIYNARVKEIMMADGGVAGGVKADTEDGELTVNAPAVVVASGGFGGSDEMITKYRPDLQGYISTNAPTIEGDAIVFLEAIGADFVDMDQVQTHPTVVQADGSLVSESLRGDGAILLNKEGVRFFDEMGTRDAVSAAINEETDQTAWLVVDQVMFDESNVIQGYVDRGLLMKFDDAAGVAEFIGAEPQAVEETFATWAQYMADGSDPDFNRQNLDKMQSDLAEGPYYVGPVGPGIHHTMGGVKINENAEVLDIEGNPIPGVFAAGEVTGGVHGGNRLGGNAVTDIVTFGRIAGASAAAYEK